MTPETFTVYSIVFQCVLYYNLEKIMTSNAINVVNYFFVKHCSEIGQTRN